MLEMIQKKSLYRSNSGTLTGGLTVSSSGIQYSSEVDASQARQGGLATFSRRPVLAELRCNAIGHSAAVQNTERHVNQLLHSGAGDLTATNDHAVTSTTQ